MEMATTSRVLMLHSQVLALHSHVLILRSLRGDLHVIHTGHGQDVPSQPSALPPSQALEGDGHDQQGRRHLHSSLQEQGSPPKPVGCPEGHVCGQLQETGNRKLGQVSYLA